MSVACRSGIKNTMFEMHVGETLIRFECFAVFFLQSPTFLHISSMSSSLILSF